MKNRVILGIDTSCYMTSMAAVTESGGVLGQVRKRLAVPVSERGLRQSEAVYVHVRQLPETASALAEQFGPFSVCAVCASSRPRENQDSYMPVFQVGDAQARTMSAILGIPCFHTDHQRGHLEAARLNSAISADRFLFVHLSGGTTEILRCSPEKLEMLGGTMDLHAGQLIDRVGVAMGLSFPAGPEVEALAARGVSRHLLPASVSKDGLHCHFSGAEAQCFRWIRNSALSPEEISAEVFDFLARSISRLLIAAAGVTGFSEALIGGGVASSSLFRGLVRDRVQKGMPGLKVFFGSPELSGDNAVGVAMYGWRQWKKLEAGV